MMPSGKDWMWIGIGLAIGWFVVPMLMSRAGGKPAASTAGY